MGDHLALGILIWIASGIVALLIISVATLHRSELARHTEGVRLRRILADSQRVARQELGLLRRQLEAVRRQLEEAVPQQLEAIAVLQERQAAALADRLTGLTEEAVAALRDHPLPVLADLADSQERRLALVAGELTRLAEVLASDAAGHAKDLRNELLESLRLTLDEFRAAHAAQLEQVRAAVDEKLESTVERRLGESFRLVSERLQVVSDRLDHVHRGLGEVQAFAAGLGHLQRAVATVRLSGNKTGTDQGAASAARARGPRRKPTVVVPSPAETPQASVS